MSKKMSFLKCLTAAALCALSISASVVSADEKRDVYYAGKQELKPGTAYDLVLMDLQKFDRENAGKKTKNILHNTVTGRDIYFTKAEYAYKQCIENGPGFEVRVSLESTRETGPVPVYYFLYGDANGDFVVDQFDATFILRNINNPRVDGVTYEGARGDLNHNFHLDTEDATILLRYLLKNSVNK